MRDKSIVEMIREELDAEFLRDLEVWRPPIPRSPAENEAAKWVSLGFLHYLLGV